MKYQIVLIIFGLTSQAVTQRSARVEEKIYEKLEESELTNVLVRFVKADTKAALERFYSLELTTTAAILDAQHAILKDHSDVIHADVKAVLNKLILKGKRHYYNQLWITAELIVRDIDRETVEILKNHRDVKSLIAELFIEPAQREECFDVTDYENIIQHQRNVENVEDGAAWAEESTERPTIIGNIDNGACFSESNTGEIDFYDWFSPTHNDDTDGIGVAPNSRWIACRGCATAACSTFDLSSCGNFLACPTNSAGGAAQCARAPQTVVNSWGTAGDSAWFNPILTALRNGGISVVFATGNNSYANDTRPSPGASVASASSLIDTVTNIIKLIGKK